MSDNKLRLGFNTSTLWIRSFRNIARSVKKMSQVCFFCDRLSRYIPSSHICLDVFIKIYLSNRRIVI